jgi:hypothetical protein
MVAVGRSWWLSSKVPRRGLEVGRTRAVVQATHHKGAEALTVISGKTRFQDDDLDKVHILLGEAKPLPLWQAAAFASICGAIIFNGIASLLEMIPQPAIHLLTPWLTTIGAILGSVAGAWHLTRNANAQQRAMLRDPQQIAIDLTGIKLSSDDADSLLRWPHFTKKYVSADLIVLRTKLNTILIVRPDTFGRAADFQQACDIIDGSVT